MLSSVVFTLLLFLQIITLASAQRTTCGPGKFFNGIRCRPCRVGRYQDERGAILCKRCPPGTFNEIRGAEGLDICLPCPAGTFSSGRGNPSKDSCTQCPPGTSSVPGSTSCIRCTPGQFLAARGNRIEWNRRISVCSSCPNNEFSRAINAQKCEKCPFPLVNNRDHTGCRRCRPGFGFDSTAEFASCVRCDSHQVSDGTAPCNICRRGFFNPELEGGSTCRPCPPGTTSDSSGSRCIPCAPEENVNVVGMPFCLPPNTPCPRNYFLNNRNGCQACSKSERYDRISNSCLPCGRNKESDGGIVTRCRRCPANRVGGRDGCVCRPGLGIDFDGSCFQCSLGRIWDRSVCRSCAGFNEIVVPGDLLCTECPPGTVPNAPRTGCVPCPSGTRASSNVGFLTQVTARCVDVRTGCPPGHRRLLSPAGELVDCSPSSCPPDTKEVFSKSTLFVGRRRDCINCTPGTVLRGNRCIACAENEVSKEGVSRRCRRCPTGFMSAAVFQLDPKLSDGNRCGCFSDFKSREFRDGKCNLCPRGSFGAVRREGGCKKCPPGMVSTSRGRTSCTICEPGTIPTRNQSGCVACPPGTTSFGVGDTECVRIGSLTRR